MIRFSLCHLNLQREAAAYTLSDSLPNAWNNFSVSSFCLHQMSAKIKFLFFPLFTFPWRLHLLTQIQLQWVRLFVFFPTPMFNICLVLTSLLNCKPSFPKASGHTLYLATLQKTQHPKLTSFSTFFLILLVTVLPSTSPTFKKHNLQSPCPPNLPHHSLPPPTKITKSCRAFFLSPLPLPLPSWYYNIQSQLPTTNHSAHYTVRP